VNKHWIAAAIWLCFLVRALFYASALPMWEGFDEYSHFAVIQHIAFHRDLPDHRTANGSRQVAESLKLLPAPWLPHVDEKRISYEEFRTLPVEERERRAARLRSMPAAWAREPADPPLGLWEAQQPPLFYWIAAPFYWAIRDLCLPAQVWILRCLAALIASAAIPLTVMTGRALGNPGLGLGAALVITAMPELMITAARISNECLALATGGLAIWLGVRALGGRHLAWFGVAAGLALLTKAYFLALIPWMLWICWKKRAVSPIIVCAAIAGWWYAHTWLATGTITGEEREVAVRAGTTISLLGAVRLTPWMHVADLVAVSYVWLGGWSFLVVRSWMYRVVELAIAVAAARLLWQRRLFGLALPVGLLAIGLAYHATTGVRTYAGAGTLGYYFYAFAAAEGILLVAGWGRFWRILVPMFVLLEGFALWFVQLPYYAGLLAHTARGGLPALRLAQLRHGGLHTLLENLAADKPFGVAGMAAITLLFFCVTAGLLAITFRRSALSARKSKDGTSPAWLAAADPSASR